MDPITEDFLNSIEKSNHTTCANILPGVCISTLKFRTFLIRIMTDIGIVLSKYKIFNFLNGRYYHPISKFVTLVPPLFESPNFLFRMKDGKIVKLFQTENFKEALLYFLGETTFGGVNFRSFVRLNKNKVFDLKTSNTFLSIEVGSFISREIFFSLSETNSVEEIREWFPMKRKILIERERMSLGRFLSGNNLLQMVIKIIL